MNNHKVEKLLSKIAKLIARANPEGFELVEIVGTLAHIVVNSSSDPETRELLRKQFIEAVNED